MEIAGRNTEDASAGKNTQRETADENTKNASAERKTESRTAGRQELLEGNKILKKRETRNVNDDKNERWNYWESYH